MEAWLAEGTQRENRAVDPYESPLVRSVHACICTSPLTSSVSVSSYSLISQTINRCIFSQTDFSAGVVLIYAICFPPHEAVLHMEEEKGTGLKISEN